MLWLGLVELGLGLGSVVTGSGLDLKLGLRLELGLELRSGSGLGLGVGHKRVLFIRQGLYGNRRFEMSTNANLGFEESCSERKDYSRLH